MDRSQFERSKMRWLGWLARLPPKMKILVPKILKSTERSVVTALSCSMYIVPTCTCTVRVYIIYRLSRSIFMCRYMVVRYSLARNSPGSLVNVYGAS